MSASATLEPAILEEIELITEKATGWPEKAKQLLIHNLTENTEPKVLSTKELDSLMRDMVSAPTEAEADALQIKIMEGFYGRRFTKRQFEEIKKQERAMFPAKSHA